MITKSFYESKAWKIRKAQVFRRDGYLCQYCKRYGRIREAKIVHHIKHLDEYPELALEPKNLVSLCIACHNKEHPEKGTAGNRARYGRMG
jgi:5-methylcytosine-specific restriction endonuclease McrA